MSSTEPEATGKPQERPDEDDGVTTLEVETRPQAAGRPSEAVECRPEAPGAVSTPLVSAIDRLLDLARVLKTRPTLFDCVRGFLAKVGLYALLGAGALALLSGIVNAFRFKSASFFWLGLVGVLAVAVVHYCAARFATAGREIIAGQSQRMASAAFLDCVGLLAVLGAIAALVLGIVGAVRGGSLASARQGLVGFFALGCVALFSLNSKETLNIEIAPEGTTPGETALAILGFVVRSVLAVAPALLGVGAAIGAVWMLVAMIVSWTGRPTLEVGGAFLTCLAAGLLPLVSYLLYVFYMLSVDLYLAVLRVARNTEK